GTITMSAISTMTSHAALPPHPRSLPHSIRGDGDADDLFGELHSLRPLTGGEDAAPGALAELIQAAPFAEAHHLGVEQHRQRRVEALRPLGPLFAGALRAAQLGLKRHSVGHPVLGWPDGRSKLKRSAPAHPMH